MMSLARLMGNTGFGNNFGGGFPSYGASMYGGGFGGGMPGGFGANPPLPPSGFDPRMGMPGQSPAGAPPVSGPIDMPRAPIASNPIMQPPTPPQAPIASPWNGGQAPMGPGGFSQMPMRPQMPLRSLR